VGRKRGTGDAKTVNFLGFFSGGPRKTQQQRRKTFVTGDVEEGGKKFQPKGGNPGGKRQTSDPNSLAGLMGCEKKKIPRGRGPWD